MRQFGRKPLFALLMALLTLAAIEAMARLVLGLVYGEYGEYEGLRTDAALSARESDFSRGRPKIHPFYGWVSWQTNHDLYIPPARPEPAGAELAVALLGGSVAQEVAHEFRSALLSHAAELDAGIASPLVFINLAHSTYRQPQQSFAFANMLANGMRFDIVVSLDGLNEIAQSEQILARSGAFPLYPDRWPSTVGMTAAERMAAGRILALRDEQEYLRERSGGIYRSATFGLLRRFRLDRIEHLIVYRHRELARAGKASHDLEKHGPRKVYTANGLRETTADAWYRGALLLADLAKRHGAEYYSFLQPNQYVPGAKPLTDEELAGAFAPSGEWARAVRQGYPLLAERGRRLRQRGVEFFDLSWIFADSRETLYVDDCCHLNRRGNELLASHMLRRILGEADPVERAIHAAGQNESYLKPYRRMRERIEAGDFGAPAARSIFDIYRKGTMLVYWKQPCTVADTGGPFFLHFTPSDGGDMGSRDFRASILDGDACMAISQLPDGGILHLRTGQYRNDREVWSVELDIVKVGG